MPNSQREERHDKPRQNLPEARTVAEQLPVRAGARGEKGLTEPPPKFFTPSLPVGPKGWGLKKLPLDFLRGV